MFYPKILAVCCFLLTQHFGAVGCVETMTASYDCSSYFTLALADPEDRLKKGIIKISEDNCPADHTFRLSGFSWKDTTCTMEITIKSTFHEASKHAKCGQAINTVKERALEIYWGTPWGCKSAEILTKVTPSYSIRRRVPAIETYQEEESISVDCDFPFFEKNRTFKARCKMNEFGGYEWVNNEASGCFYKAIANVTDEMIKKVKDRVKGPVRCQAIFMMLHEMTKQRLRNTVRGVKAMQTVHTFLTKWDETCADLTPRENKLLRHNLFVSLQMFIRMIISHERKEVISGHQFYALLYRIMLVLNRHTQSCKGSFMSANWQTSHIGVFRYSTADVQGILGTKNEAFRVDGQQPIFQLTSLPEAIPIGITCFRVKDYQYLINMGNLKLISDVCFFASFQEGTTSVQHIPAPRGTSITLMFPLIIWENREYECILLDVRDTVQKVLVPRKCLTERMYDAYHCTCSDFGLIVVSQTTNRSLNLKTQVTGTYLLGKPFQMFAIFVLALNVLSNHILLISSLSHFLRRAYRIQQSRYSIKFRDFSLFVLCGSFTFAYYQFKGIHECSNFKNCKDIGPSLLAFRYGYMVMHFNYLLAVVLAKRTQQLGGLMFNISIGTFLGMKIFETILRKYYEDRFLNSGCMPDNFMSVAIHPTIALLGLSLFLLANHLRTANHRYMAEWLGCVIHTLGWLIVVIFSIFLNHGEASMGGGNLVTLTYTSVFVMDLVEVLYFTYLKPNMIIYYHRLYLVWVRKKTLENAAVEQLTSHILSCMYNLDTDSAAKSSSRTSTRTSSTATSSSLNTTSDSDYSTSRDSSKKSKDEVSDSSRSEGH